MTLIKYIYKNKKVKKLIIQISEVAEYLWQRGWAERSAGNISINITNLITDDANIITENLNKFTLKKPAPHLANMFFLVTGTGKRMRDISKKPLKNILIIKLNESGTEYWIISQYKNEKSFLPTSELPTHLSIHEKLKLSGSKNKVVMHAHTNELIALTQIKKFNNSDALNKILFGMHPETMLFIPKEVGFVKYAMTGTLDIAEKTLEIIDKYDVIIWEKHGVLVVGENVIETFDTIDILAKSAKIYFTCKSAGFEPDGLTDKELKALKEAYV